MTAGKKLAVNVTVGGTTHEAGSVPPAEVAKQIDNPKAWEQDGPKPASKSKES